jgi:hypothetical protein
MRRLISIIFLSLLATLGPLGAGAQMDGGALMAEGNELFRDGLHRAALLRYREANAAGLDTPLLHYNLGVTQYKLEHYSDAAASLERAAQDPALAPLALYNLGLTAHAQGEAQAAERWFRLALERAERTELRAMAGRALQTLAAGTPAVAQTRRARRIVTPRDQPVGEFNFLVVARIGQDDNIYRSPSQPYVDLAQAGQPLVTPVVQSGSFMPVDLLAEYVLFNEAGDTDFNFTYVMNGDFYDSEFNNANEVSQRFEIGADVVLGERDRHRRTLQSAFFLRDHKETNFDPDDGLDRDINGVDISDRFSYGAAGVRTEYEHTLGPWTWGFDLRFERRRYHDEPLVDNYDHELYFTRASAQYAFSDVTRLSVGGRYYRRFYDERLSRDSNGDLLAANLPLRYKYRGVQLGVEQDLGARFRLEFDYLRLDRMDQFQGYYDYDQDVFRLGATYRPNRRLRLSVAALSRVYDYSQAQAFNDPAGGPREFDDVEAELLVEYQITPRLGLWMELTSEEVTSTDPRAEYARAQSTLGVKWRQ